MPADRENTQSEPSVLECLHHSVFLLIFLDLITLGLYSAARSYLIHDELSRKARRRLFSPAFLHILIVLNLLLWVLRFSRESTPWDAAIIMTRLGAGLLLIAILLVFRRHLRHEYRLHIQPLPLAIFDLWYLQYKINRKHREAIAHQAQESWLVILAVILGSLGASLVLCTVNHYHISGKAMEPTLIPGDHVLVDQLSYWLEKKPKRGDLLVYKTLQNKKNVQVKRVLGLPGDRLGFHGDLIQLNGKPLPCEPIGEEVPGSDAIDQAVKRLFRCEMEGHVFTLQHYREGALTAVHGDFEVPSDHYFLIGDNLDNSLDSRTLGPVPAQDILGHARMTTISYRVGESFLWDRWFKLL